MDDFVETRLGRFYGGSELARRYVSAATSDEKEPKVLIRRYGDTQEVARDQHLTADQRRRWSDLAREMARRLSLLGST